MTSLFRQGEAALDRMFELAAVPVSYRRDGVTVAVDIPAKLGKTLFRADDNYGVTIRTERRDFILRASDLPLKEPKSGDEIRFDGKCYQVNAPNGEPCWRWHTRLTHTQLRIHANYIGDAKNE